MQDENTPDEGTQEAGYHQAPHTLDSQREIPEDAPPSAGHDEAKAEQVRAADEAFTEGLEDQPDEDVGARAPGDHAGEIDDPSETDEQREQREDAERAQREREQEQEQDSPDAPVQPSQPEQQAQPQSEQQQPRARRKRGES